MVAEPEQLALAAFARRDAQHLREDAFTHLRHRRRAVEDFAAVQVHVFGQPVVHRRVGRQFDRRDGLGTEHRAAPRREQNHVGAAGDLPGGRAGVESRRVHEDKAGYAHRLGVTVDRHQPGRATTLSAGCNRITGPLMRLADKSIMGGLKVSDVDSFSMALDSLGQPQGVRLVDDTAQWPGLDSAAGSWVGRALRV